MAISSVTPEHRIARLTVEQLEGMVAAGILKEGAPIELVDGVLVYKDRSAWGEDPMTVGKRHSLVVKLLARLDAELERHGCHMQTQNPIQLPPRDEPAPDGAIVRGQPRDYTSRTPTASDTFSVIEVADSSLEYDRSSKLAMYARAGIRQYVIVDLRHDCIEVYERPADNEARYEAIVVVRRGEVLALAAGDAVRLNVEVEQLLP